MICIHCQTDCTTRPDVKVWDSSTAKKNGWFSRRHRTNEAHEFARREWRAKMKAKLERAITYRTPYGVRVR